MGAMISLALCPIPWALSGQFLQCGPARVGTAIGEYSCHEATSAPLTLVQTGRVGSQVANISLNSTESGKVMKQYSLFDNVIDSVKL